ncbi:unnamed protein product, partial [Enterobius vermicularis]|uniref:Uncharacterized protein n=1 Tax=Enterobius vermicularis TaxID=51028 RepID=A0A0N4UUZ2_ENTVE
MHRLSCHLNLKTFGQSHRKFETTATATPKSTATMTATTTAAATAATATETTIYIRTLQWHKQQILIF